MALTKERESFLKALMELRDFGPTVDEYMGICYNGANIADPTRSESELYNGFYKFIAEESKAWSKYSGNESFPIPPKGGFMWHGEEGALRYELIDFLIAKLVEEDRKS